MTDTTTGADSLLSAIENASTDTLKELQQRIEETQRVLKSLLAAEQLVATSLGVELPNRGPMWRSGQLTTPAKRPAADRSTRQPGASTSDRATAVPADGDGESNSDLMNKRRRAVYRYVMHNGITSQTVLAEDLNIPKGSMTAVLNHKWFDVQPDGVRLAK